MSYDCLERGTGKENQIMQSAASSLFVRAPGEEHSREEGETGDKMYIPRD